MSSSVGGVVVVWGSVVVVLVVSSVGLVVVFVSTFVSDVIGGGVTVGGSVDGVGGVAVVSWWRRDCVAMLSRNSRPKRLQLDIMVLRRTPT